MNETKDVQRRGAEFFVSWKDRRTDKALTDAELAQLVRIADLMIPAGGGWPAPSSTEVGGYIREGAHRSADVTLLREIVHTVGPALAEGAQQAGKLLAAVQAAKPLAFRVLQEFVYYAYYAQPEVVRAVRTQLDCDYISPPQPHGYTMPPDAGLSPPRHHSYVPTTEVRRVDLSALDLSDKFSQGGKAC
ncbi:MAG: hypothetical protein V4787_10045 [Pseudomonadota bacterium]